MADDPRLVTTGKLVLEDVDGAPYPPLVQSAARLCEYVHELRTILEDVLVLGEGSGMRTRIREALDVDPWGL